MLADCADAAPRHAHTALCDLEAERAAQLEAHLCLFIFIFSLLIQSELLQAVP